MAKPVIMPRLGQSVESCTIAHWLKKKGDNVKKGEVLLSYETDKALFNLEAEDEGLLLELFYNEGDEVPVLANIAVIGNAGESVDEFRPGGVAKAIIEEPSTTQSQPANIEKQSLKPEQKQPAVVESISIPDGKINISPRARNLAEKLKIYYYNIKGTLPQGRIIERDIQAVAVNAPRLTPTSAEIISGTELVPGGTVSGMGGRITEKDLVTAGASAGDFEVVKTLVAGVGAKMKKNKVEVIISRALIKGRTSEGITILADGKEFQCKNILIATGMAFLKLSSTVFAPILLWWLMARRIVTGVALLQFTVVSLRRYHIPVCSILPFLKEQLQAQRSAMVWQSEEL